MRRSIVLLAVALLAALLVPASAGAQETRDPRGPTGPSDPSPDTPGDPSVGDDPAPYEDPATTGVDGKAPDRPIDRGYENPEVLRGRLKPGVQSLSLPEPGAVAKSPDSAISLRLPDGSRSLAGSTATVAVFDEQPALSTSPLGVAIALDASDIDSRGIGLPGGTTVEVDLSNHGLRSGGSVAGRLQMYQYDDCEIDRNEQVACENSSRLPTWFDETTRLLTFEIPDDLPASRNPLVDQVGPRPSPSERPKPNDGSPNTTPGPALDSGLQSPSTGEGPDDGGSGETAQVVPGGGVDLENGGGTMYGLGAGVSGAVGDFSASPITELGPHEVGLFTGAATTAYSLSLPAAAAGPTPTMSLGYSSGSVDGMNASTNNQPGPVGLGWSLNFGGSITRTFDGCAQYFDPPLSASIGDKCLWGSWDDMNEERFILSLNGRSSPLIRQSGNVFRMQSDPMWKITRFKSAAHNFAGAEWWQVITPDGTKYRLGYGANSAQHVPVYYPSSNGSAPCSASSRLCDTVWRWDLDLIQDLRDNRTTVTYQKELNNYQAKANGTLNTSDYVRSAVPRIIEYGATSAAGSSNARVVLAWEERCGSAYFDVPDDPTAASPGLAVQCDWWGPVPGGGVSSGGNYVDTPGDLWCLSNNCDQTSPSFWSQLRLGTVQTQIRRAGGWATVETHDLSSAFPTELGIDDEPKLYLDGVDRRPGGDYEHYGFNTIQAEDRDGGNGAVAPTNDVGGGDAVTGLKAGNTLQFNRTWLGNDTGYGRAHSFFVRYSTADSGREIRLKLDGATVQTLSAPATYLGSYRTLEFRFGDYFQNSGGHGGVKNVTIEVVGGGAGGSGVAVNWSRFEVFNLDQAVIGGTNPYSFNFLLFTFAAFPVLRGPYYGRDIVGPSSLQWLPNREDGVVPMFMPRIGRVLDPTGGETWFTYGQTHGCHNWSSTNPWYWNQSDCYPAWDSSADPPGWGQWNKWKVTKLRRQDFTTAGYSPQATMEYRYSYSAPQWALAYGHPSACASRTWNDFRGHNIVTVQEYNGNTPGARTEHRFFNGLHFEPNSCADPGSSNQGTVQLDLLGQSADVTDFNWLRGMKYQEIRRKSNGQVSRYATTTYGHAPVTASGSGATDREKARFVGVTRQETFLEGFSATDKRTRTDYAWDSYGNVTAETHAGDTNETGDERTVVREFDLNTSKWILSPVCREEVKNHVGSVIARTRTSYNANNTAGSTSCDGTPNNVEALRSWSYQSSSMASQTRFEYTTRGQLNKTIDPRNNSITLTIDGTHGRVTKSTNQLGWQTHYSYDAVGRVQKTTNVNGNNTYQAWDDYNRLTRVWYPSQHSNPVGLPSSAPSVEYAYQPNARPAKIIEKQLFDKNQSGENRYLITANFFDGFARPIQTQTRSDDAGRRWINSTGYNYRGLTTWTTAASFEKAGAPGADYQSHPWDANNAQTPQNVVRSSYDELGRQTESRFRGRQGGNVTFEMVSRTQYTAWSTRNYDASSQNTSQNGTLTEHVSDAYGNLVQVREYTGGAGQPNNLYATTKYAYDGLDRLTKVERSASASNGSNPNAVTNIEYDWQGNKTRLDDPDSGVWLYEYDASANLTLQRDGRSKWTKMSYDGLNRLTSTRVSNSSGASGGVLLASNTWHSQQPGLGHVWRTRSYTDSGAGPEVVTYNNAITDDGYVGKQNWEVKNGATTYYFEARHTFGPAGQVLTSRLPNGATTSAGSQAPITAPATMSYDWRTGSPESLTDHAGTQLVKSVNYDKTGRMTQRFRPRNSTADYHEGWVYDYKNLRLANYRAGVGDTSYTNSNNLVANRHFYDQEGLITRSIDYTNSWQRQCYGYDTRDRLTRAFTDNTDGCDGYTATGTPNTNYNETYGYDRLHNLVTKTNYSPISYGAGSAGPHAATSAAGGRSYNYDANGNMTRRKTPSVDHTFTYDHRDRLTEAVQTSGGTPVASFAYDANGTRVKRTQNGTTTIYLGDFFEYDINGAVRRWLYRFGGELIAIKKNSNTPTLLFSDRLSTVGAQLVRGQDYPNVIRQRYKPWGNDRGGTANTITDHGFTGQREDRSIELLDYQARPYDPDIGRFVRPDSTVPYGANAASFNRYSYVQNNPTNRVDPSGNTDLSALSGCISNCLQTITAAVAGQSAGLPTGDVAEAAVTPEQLHEWFIPAHNAAAAFVNFQVGGMGPCHIPGGGAGGGSGFPDVCSFGGRQLEPRNGNLYIWEVKNLSEYGVLQGAVDINRYLKACQGGCATGGAVVPGLVVNEKGDPVVVLNGGSPGLVHYASTTHYRAWRNDPSLNPAAQKVLALDANAEYLEQLDSAAEHWRQHGALPTVGPRSTRGASILLGTLAGGAAAAGLAATSPAWVPALVVVGGGAAIAGAASG